MGKIRLVQLVDGFRLGGAETKLLELIKKLDKNRYWITVCSLLDTGPLQSDFEALGIGVEVLSRRHRFDGRLILRLAQFLHEKRVDIVQTTLFYADVLGPVAARMTGVPVVISWETASHYQSSHALWHRGLAYRFAMKFVDRIVAVSDGVKHSLLALRNIESRKIRTIHYGVDLTRFGEVCTSAKKAELGLSLEFPIIGIVARLDVVKGHRYLIDALPTIQKRYPDAQCVIVGEGECRGELEEQCRALGLRDAVHFLGFRHDVSEIMSVLDVFALPSISEGFPNALLEAMASSVAVVATPVGGILEVVFPDENGKIVPPKDSHALAEAILGLADDPEKMRQLGCRGRSVVEEKFSLETQVRQFQDLYEGLLEEKGYRTEGT